MTNQPQPDERMHTCWCPAHRGGECSCWSDDTPVNLGFVGDVARPRRGNPQ